MITSQEVSTFKTSPVQEETLLRVRFTKEVDMDQEVLLEFTDPDRYRAVCTRIQADSIDIKMQSPPENSIDIWTIPHQANDSHVLGDELLQWVAKTDVPAVPPIIITIHGAQIILGSSRAILVSAPSRLESLLLALVDFCYYNSELRKLENEVAENWAALESDTPLANQVTVRDRDRFDAITQRFAATQKRRMRLTRIAPYLYKPRASFTPLANQLMDRLRERTHMEVRHEALISQMEVFGNIYEMSSQRISDFKSTNKEQTLEWVIIVLLATETLLLLIEMLWTLGG